MLFDIQPDLSALTSQLSSDYVAQDGTVFTGNNGFTVTDNYTCNATPCGGFTIGGVVAEGGMSTSGTATTDLSFLNTSSFDGAGNEYTGSNGYTVTDSYSCGSGACGGFTMGSFPASEVVAGGTSTAGTATTDLSFINSSSFDGAGNEYTGYNGYSVTDSYTCGSGACGGYTVGSFPGAVVVAGGQSTAGTATTDLSFINSSSFDGAGNEYTGNNGYTVTDSYSCGSGACGGYTMGSFPATVVVAGGPSTAGTATTDLAFLNSSSFDGAGNEYTGSNGYTVVDSYSCGSGECGGFTMGSFPATTTEGGTSTLATQLAAPVAAAEATKDAKPSRPHISHYLMCGHALALGAFTATINAGDKMLKGEKVDASSWNAEFQQTAEQAANAVTPVGGYILSNQVFAKAQEA